MTTKNTGGYAFPQHTFEPNPNGGEPRIIWQEGMTLRDYFAAKASDEDIADAMSRIPKVERIVNSVEGKKAIVLGLPDDARQIARYRCADAMLKAREA